MISPSEVDFESLKRKQRSDAFLHSLNVDQACQVVAWMDQFPDLSVVRKCITAPPPEGFGIQVSIAALRRLRSHWHAMDCSRAVEQMMDLVTDLEETVHQHQTPRVQNVIALLLHERALELARTAPGSDVLKDVLTSIDKLSALEHKRLKIALDREKFRRPHQTLPPSAPAPRHHRVDLHVISTPAPQPIPPPVLP